MTSTSIQARRRPRDRGRLATFGGAFFATVIERLSPAIRASDERLIVDLLTEVSRLQSRGTQEQARPWCIAGVLSLSRSWHWAASDAAHRGFVDLPRELGMRGCQLQSRAEDVGLRNARAAATVSDE
jgi:hypothetical protein